MTNSRTQTNGKPLKLYFAAEAISLAPHIVLIEQDFEYELVRVNPVTLRASDGTNYQEVNPVAYVPTLLLENERRLSEAPAIIQYLADMKPETGLTAPLGSWGRVRLWEALSYLSSELHSLCIPLFMPEIPVKVKNYISDKLKDRLTYLANRVHGRRYIMGPDFTVADAYVFPILEWLPRFGIDLHSWPELLDIHHNIANRASVQAALEEEAAFPPC